MFKGWFDFDGVPPMVVPFMAMMAVIGAAFIILAPIACNLGVLINLFAWNGHWIIKGFVIAILLMVDAAILYCIFENH